MKLLSKFLAAIIIVLCLLAFSILVRVSSSQCCQSYAPGMNQTIHSTQNFTLITRLTKTQLCLSLQEFDFQGDAVTEYQISLTNETLPEEMGSVFKSVNQLYQEYFQKSGNYSLEKNGLIYFRLMVMRQNQPALEQQVTLTMTHLSKSVRQQYSAYIQKLKQNTKGQIEQMTHQHEKMIEEYKKMIEENKKLSQKQNGDLYETKKYMQICVALTMVAIAMQFFWNLTL